jgi:hypothetical protein
VKCRECEEWLAAPEGGDAGGEPPEGVAAHLARCASCREFRAHAGEVAAALAGWDAPHAPPEAALACQEALLARFAGAANSALVAPEVADRTERHPWSARLLTLPARVARHPASIGVLGAVAAAGGAAMAPSWVQQVAIGWAAGAAVLASLVLLCHGRPTIARGERL